ncbi:mov34/MPN/PAD-1 family protein, putative [Babesia bigemina]|uniref:Mov34/MPN/PAD-1 family protein, putative n=1 Tax=Babesia bigemina TaxID=5866 RepID=A0A061DB45_BABBI|nr:mov34/MPN/PAD-1 family protein, putative [Babesia bigemina]CDR94950.1 mov34/MPN/PAD-1 family protein, putative [Babesia bigemina]|eukprot:XP_012767136.1 mov34/MPN/PAD-1 family protein, putative [Babesia bigemina]
MADGKIPQSLLGDISDKLGSKCFQLSSLPPVKWKLHPVVIFTILDSYMRREEGQHNIIGTLMGIVTEGNVVEITDCFVDRHSLTDEGLLQIIKDHHESMYELKQKVNPKEQVVGWFSTGGEMTELTCAVHGWFKQFNSVSKFYPQTNLYEPVHLLVDATCDSGSMVIKAFVQLPLNLTKEACFQFHEVELELVTSPNDSIGISTLLRSMESAKSRKADRPREASTFDIALSKLSDLLDACIKRVEAALSGQKGAELDPEVGRFLLRATTTESIISQAKLEKLSELALQDNLMIAYLSNLANLQFALAEHLNASF